MQPIISREAVGDSGCRLPMIQVQVANQEWAATIDTGFNGDAVPDRRGHSKMPALFYQPCKSKWFVVYLKKTDTNISIDAERPR